MKDTRQRILRTALSCFTEKNYEHSSLNDVAQALGITKGGIYHYFKSKDDLFREVVLFIMEEIQKQYILLTEPRDGVSLKHSLRLLYALEDLELDDTGLEGFDIVGNYENTLYLVFTALKKFPEIHEKMSDIYSTLIDRLSILLQNAQDNGEIQKDLDIEALAFEICAYNEGALMVGNFIKSVSLKRISLRSFENFWNRIKN